MAADFDRLAQDPNKPCILIVDDSLTVRMDLQEIFESAGFSTSCCESLAAARYALAARGFALVVLDVLLPDGDGIDLLHEIKARAPVTPAVLLSTEAEVRDRVRGLKTGADDYIVKPYDSSYLLARARQLIGARERRANDARPVLLLIDDSATFRAEFRSMLEPAGYSVTTSDRGEEGLNQAFAVRPDAIIIDHVMPGGMDGDAVIRRLKQDVTLRNTPCLLLTGSAGPSEELHALEVGADAWLSKDTDANVILARLAALLRPERPALAVESPISLLSAKRILAVDDSITFLNELSEQLRAEGYGVVQAKSGKEALELLEVQAVDCILLDVRMPELSGTEVARLIKRRPALRNIPLLMLTAVEEPAAVIEGINAGADDYVSKSGDFSVLKARVRAQLRRRQFEDENRRIREELLEKDLEAAEARAAEELAEARAALVEELESKNHELEAFAYSASHDLRAPLRAVRGFSQALLDDFGSVLPLKAKEHVGRIQAAARRMGRLMDALLEMSRTGRANLHRQRVDISAMAHAVVAEVAESQPDHRVECKVEEGLTASADAALLRVALNNLLANAWKFTGKTSQARIEVGALHDPDPLVYFVRDNGVGFDPAGARRLFQPFERLHAAGDFPGAGIGLATVRRIMERHGGKIWAESAVGRGATFFFTLEPAQVALNGAGDTRFLQIPSIAPIRVLCARVPVRSGHE